MSNPSVVPRSKIPEGDGGSRGNGWTILGFVKRGWLAGVIFCCLFQWFLCVCVWFG